MAFSSCLFRYVHESGAFYSAIEKPEPKLAAPVVVSLSEVKLGIKAPSVHEDVQNERLRSP
jgi:hypothetical protein